MIRELKVGEKKQEENTQIVLIGHNTYGRFKPGMVELSSSEGDDVLHAIMVMFDYNEFHLFEIDDQAEAFEYYYNKYYVEPEKYPLKDLKLIQVDADRHSPEEVIRKMGDAQVISWDPMPMADCIWVLFYDPEHHKVRKTKRYRVMEEELVTEYYGDRVR